MVDQQDRLNDAETRLRRLVQAIENGLTDLSDPTFKERMDAVRNERDMAKMAVANLLAELEPEAKITEEKISAFIDLMRKNLEQGDVNARRAYLHAVVDTIEIDDGEIRIHGRKSDSNSSGFRARHTKRTGPHRVVAHQLVNPQTKAGETRAKH